MLPFVILAASSPYLTLLSPSTSSPDLLFLHKGKDIVVKNVLSLADTVKCECRSAQQGAELWRWAVLAALQGSAGTNCQMTPGTRDIVVTIVLILASVSRERSYNRTRIGSDRPEKWKMACWVTLSQGIQSLSKLSDWSESCFFLYVIFILWSSAGIKYYHTPSQF